MKCRKNNINRFKSVIKEPELRSLHKEQNIVTKSTQEKPTEIKNTNKHKINLKQMNKLNYKNTLIWYSHAVILWVFHVRQQQVVAHFQV